MRCEEHRAWFPQAESGDLMLVFGPWEAGKMPLKEACLKTRENCEALEGVMTALGWGLLLGVHAHRTAGTEELVLPLEERQAEVDHYRACGCVLRRSGDAHSNFYTVEPSGSGTVWVRNQGPASLRFQMPGGQVYRVCGGCTEALSEANPQARTGPLEVLLELGGNPLDFLASGVRARYGVGPWRQGDLSYDSGLHVDSYTLRPFCGDDCLGVLESHSGYFLEAPRLDFLDIESYGPSAWYVRNRGKRPLALTWPEGARLEVPADGSVYSLEALRNAAKGGSGDVL